MGGEGLEGWQSRLPEGRRSSTPDILRRQAIQAGKKRARGTESPPEGAEGSTRPPVPKRPRVELKEEDYNQLLPYITNDDIRDSTEKIIGLINKKIDNMLDKTLDKTLDEKKRKEISEDAVEMKEDAINARDYILNEILKDIQLKPVETMSRLASSKDRITKAAKIILEELLKEKKLEKHAKTIRDTLRTLEVRGRIVGIRSSIDEAYEGLKSSQPQSEEQSSTTKEETSVGKGKSRATEPSELAESSQKNNFISTVSKYAETIRGFAIARQLESSKSDDIAKCKILEESCDAILEEGTDMTKKKAEKRKAALLPEISASPTGTSSSRRDKRRKVVHELPQEAGASSSQAVKHPTQASDTPRSPVYREEDYGTTEEIQKISLDDITGYRDACTSKTRKEIESLIELIKNGYDIAGKWKEIAINAESDGNTELTTIMYEIMSNVQNRGGSVKFGGPFSSV